MCFELQISLCLHTLHMVFMYSFSFSVAGPPSSSVSANARKYFSFSPANGQSSKAGSLCYRFNCLPFWFFRMLLLSAYLTFPRKQGTEVLGRLSQPLYSKSPLHVCVFSHVTGQFSQSPPHSKSSSLLFYIPYIQRNNFHSWCNKRSPISQFHTPR